MIRFANHEEIKNWNTLVAKNPDQGHIYQSLEWGDFKAKFGWQPVRLILNDQIAVQLLKKAVPFVGNIYYCPKGPGIFESYKKDAKSIQIFKQFTKQIKDFILQNDKKANLIKIEPELLEGELDLSKLGYQKASQDLQFKATIIVDISQKEEEILSGFKQKTRYNINLAKKRGVTIEMTTMDEMGVDLMYRLMRSTQKRAGFFLRKKAYFQKYWQDLAKAKMGQLLIAKYQEQVLAGVFATIFNKKAYYKDGGSFSIYRNLMAPYLLQWEAIKWAKSKGATSYDLVAVPPKDQLDNPNHPQSGLYQFKRSFNSQVTEFVGCWDLVLIEKNRWAKAEKYYNRLYAKIYRNLFY